MKGGGNDELRLGALGLAMIAAFLLAGLRHPAGDERDSRGRGMLMILAAVVFVRNVMIGTV